MRYNDVRHGRNIAEEVLKKYWPALQQKNMISPNGLFVDALLVRQSFPASSKSIGFTAWYALPLISTTTFKWRLQKKIGPVLI
jgi:hypothetical protein